MENLDVVQVTNDFKQGRRRLLVHNSCDGQDHIISWEEGNNRAIFELPEPGCYLHINVAPGPGELDRTRIDLPVGRYYSFTFTPIGIRNIRTSRSEWATIRIPPAQPSWSLRVERLPDSPEQRAAALDARDPEPEPKDPTNVTIGDDGPQP